MSEDKFYQIEFGSCYCCCTEFIVNGIDAYYDDFGEKYDRAMERAEPYCCGDMRFTRHADIAKVNECLSKYGITIEQFNEIANELEKGLSFGECGWCE